MQTILSFITPLLVCLAAGSGVALAGRVPFGRALPVGLLGLGAALYVGTLLTGRFWVGCALAVAALAACWVAAARRKGWQGAAGLLLTPGLAAFLLLYLYLFALHAGRGLAWWDEFSHWAAMPREILRTGALYTAPGSLLAVHQDYPPFFALLQAAWCALCGGYSEPALYRCLHTVLLSLFLPLLENNSCSNTKKPRWAFAVLGLVLAVASCGVVCGDVPFFTSLYLDCAMGLLFAHGVWVVLAHPAPTRFAALDLALTAAALLLTKQMALAFYLVLLVLALFCWLPSRRWALLAGALAPPLAASWAWSLHLRLRGISGQFSFSISQIFQLPAIYRGAAGEEWQQTACFNYVSAVWGKNIWAGSGGRMEFSYRHLIVIFALALAVLFWLARRRFGGLRLAALWVLLVGGSVAWAVGMGALYVFSFGPVEGPTLASFVRYMASYWFAVGAVIVTVLLGWLGGILNNTTQKNAPKTALVLCAAACALVLAEQAWEQPKNLARLAGYQDVSEDAAAAQALAREMDAQIPAGASVYVVDRGSSADTVWPLRYYLYPHALNTEGFCPGPARYEGDAWAQPDLTPGDQLWRMQQFDYVYIAYADNVYLEDAAELYPDGGENGALYKVEGDQLVRVN